MQTVAYWEKQYVRLKGQCKALKRTIRNYKQTKKARMTNRTRYQERLLGHIAALKSEVIDLRKRVNDNAAEEILLLRKAIRNLKVKLVFSKKRELAKDTRLRVYKECVNVRNGRVTIKKRGQNETRGT